MPLKIQQLRTAKRGFILFVYTLAIAMIVLVLGLAIDAGVLYVVKGRLQAAADAGALAAARSLNLDLSTGVQTTDAQNAASSFFGANFPNGLWGTSGSTMTTNLAYGTGTTANTLNINATAFTRAPTYFMRWLGYTTVPLNVTGTASRRDVNLVLVLDRSGSMCTVGAVDNPPCGKADTATPCAAMINAAESFVDRFSNNRDTLGLVVFNAGAQESFVANANFNPSIKTVLDNVVCNGWTGTTNAMRLAYSRLQTLNNPGKLNAVVLFTDGQANTIVGDFPPTGGCTSLPTGSLTQSAGLFDYASIATPETVVSGSCSIPNSIAYVPATDHWNNATHGFRTNWDDASQTFTSPDLISGNINPNLPQAIINAASNTLDDQAKTARNNAALNPMIMTIGLGGNAGAPPDAQLLIRVANAPSGLDLMGNVVTNPATPTGAFDASKQVGIYVYSPSASQLLGAFSKVGSFLVELTK